MTRKKQTIKDNVNFFDWWSLWHLISGIVVGTILLKCGVERMKLFLTWVLFILIAWEAFEVLLRLIRKKKKRFYKFLRKFMPAGYFVEESKVNIFSDILVGTAGAIVIYLVF